MSAARGGRRAAIVAVATALVLAACSGGSSGDDEAVAPADPDATGTTREIPSIATADDIELSSTDLDDDGTLSPEIACETYGGEGRSPQLSWSGIPPAAANLVLVVHDPDAPIEGGFTHLIARFEPTSDGVEAGADVDLNNPMGPWIPVCPPPGEEHRYTFTLYVFPGEVGIPAQAAKADIDILSADAIGQAQVTGRYAAPES